MRYLRIRIIGVSYAIFFLFGCMATEPKYVWLKSDTLNVDANYLIADSKCLAESYKAIPVDAGKEDCSKLSGFNRGFCSGAAARQGQQVRLLRNQIYDGCMIAEGWEKHLSE